MKRLGMLVLVLCLALVAMPISAEGFDGEYKIGLVSMRTGMPADSESMMNGAQMAADELNSNGGILGKKVVIIEEDGAMVADVALNAVNKLINEEHVDIIMGLVISGQALGVEATIKEKGLPTICMGTSPKLKHNIQNEWLFRTRPSDEISAEVAAKLLVEEMGCKTIGILHTGDDFGQGGRDVMVEYCDEMGVKTIAEAFNTTDQDVTGQLMKFRSGNVDGIILWANTPVVAARQIYELGFKVPVVGNNGVSSASNIEACEPEWLDSWYVVCDLSYDSSDPLVQEFLASYLSKFDILTLQTHSATCYSTVMWIADAVERAGTVDKAAVREQLAATVGFQGINGVYEMIGDQVDMIAQCAVTQFETQDDGSLALVYIRDVVAR